MKNSIQFKSAQSLVNELVNQFASTDFAPPINRNVIKQKFIDVVSRDDAYWDVLNESENPEWCILALKSHNPSLHFKTKMCFGFEHDRIRIVVCNDSKVLQYLQQDGLSISSPGIHVNHSIFYRDFWKNHENLYIAFLDVFERSLEYVDREKVMAPFPSSALTMNKELDEICA